MGRNHKSVVVAPAYSSEVHPFEVPLPKGGEAFWLDTRTIAHAVSEGEGNNEVLALYAYNVNYRDDTIYVASENAPLIGKLPTNTATNFIYQPRQGMLVFSDNVYMDGNITNVKRQDEAWENRGNSALVYDKTYERHVRMLC